MGCEAGPVADDASAAPTKGAKERPPEAPPATAGWSLGDSGGGERWKSSSSFEG